MNPNAFDQVFNSLVAMIPGQEVKPVTLPPLTGPGKTQPIPKTFPGQAGAGILMPPLPEDTAKGIPSWDGVGWKFEDVQKWVNDFFAIQVKGFGWNVLIVLLLLIAFFVMLTGESNPVAAYERLKPA